MGYATCLLAKRTPRARRSVAKRGNRLGLIRVALALALGSLPGLLLDGFAGVPAQAVASSSMVSSESRQSNVTESIAAPIELLNVEPVKGYGGETFTVTGENLPPDTEIEFVWVTWDGSYATNVSIETIEFYEPQFAEQQVTLGRASTDANGGVYASFIAPEDFGGAHDIYAVVDGENLARGGFQILRSVTITPAEGPVGTPITIAVTGLGWKALERALSVRYGNQYTGYITGVTTRGTAIAQIRATGPPGLYPIELSGLGIHGGGYLNNQQSPYAHLFPETGSYSFAFTVTDDDGPPSDMIEWPDRDRALRGQNAARTTASALPAAPGERPLGAIALEPDSGSILTEVSLRADDLAPDTEVELFWITARGNRVSPSGWELWEISLGQAVTDQDGALTMAFEIPDDLGGWHVVQLMQSDIIVAEVPFYVEPSLVEVTPKQVRAGEPFTIQLKGIGWTELDNTVAVTYNNAYIGYACGFNSSGDITLYLIATGGPGTHLIDIYPTTYQGQGKRPWGFQMPHLNALNDHPSLGLGYNLPVYRLAIEVVE